jgi:hypothetical protein
MRFLIHEGKGAREYVTELVCGLPARIDLIGDVLQSEFDRGIDVAGL